MKTLIFVLLAVCTVPVSSSAAELRSLAAVTITAPLAIEQIRPLRFGMMACTFRPGTLTITPFDERYTTGGVHVCGRRYNSAELKIFGEPGAMYRIGLPAKAIAIGGCPWHREQLVADNFRVVSAANGPLNGSSVIDSNGLDHLRLGATLHVPACSRGGKYKLSLPVEVDYQ